MAGIVVFALFITTSLCVIKAEEPVTAKLSARRDGPVHSDPESCVPGRFYQGPGCSKCFCDAEKKKVCSPPGTCKLEGVGADKVLTKDELIHTVNRVQLYRVPSLPNTGAKCSPGMSYRVDCNRCVCIETQSLMCEELLCPTNDEINKRQAMELSGKPCEGSDVKNQECVKCSCKDGKYACEAKDGCISPVALLNLQRGTTKKHCFPGMSYPNPNGGPPCACTIYGKLQCPTAIIPTTRSYPSKMGPLMTLRGRLHSTQAHIITIPNSPENEMPFEKALLDPKSDKKCIPNMVYRVDKCNRCICSATNTLRCTEMLCVNDDTGLLPWQTTSKRKLIGSKIIKHRPAYRRAKCMPGSTFRHECDTCVCDDSGQLRCTNAVCPNAEKKDIPKSEYYDEGV